MIGSYRGSGEASYHPAILLGILVYGYATGVFSSRKLERATYDSVAFRFIAANEHPDHDTIAAFRRRFLKEIEALFVQVLLLAREMGVLKMGTVALDGTKIHANASRHSALSYEHAGKIEAQLQAEVADLMAKAEAADQADLPDGMSIPDELARREKRLAELARAQATIEARAKERYDREQAEYEAKLAARDAKTAATGKKPSGKPPAAAGGRPLPTDQVNLTDEDSRIMPVAGGGFEQCYNAQAAVAAGSLLVVAADVVQATNDKQQLEPMLDKLGALPDELGKAETLLADNGYFSEANVRPAWRRGIDPLIAMGRQPHHPPLAERFAAAPPLPENPTPVEAMAHRLKTPEGKKLYALRKQTPEPVFGIIKSVLGFRQFLLRGLDKVRGEWSLVTKQRAAMRRSESNEVLIVEAQRAAGDREPRGQGMCDRAADHRLARAQLADDAENAAWREFERKSPDHLDVSPTECGADGEIRRREDGQALPAMVKPHVERASQSVAKQVESGHRQEDRRHRQKQRPWRLGKARAGISDHLSPCDLIGRDAETDERQHRLDDHRDAHLQAEQSDQQWQCGRQDFTCQRLQMCEPGQACRRDVVPLRGDQHLGAQHAAEARPIDQHDGEHHLVGAGSQADHEDQAEDDRRKRHPHLDRAADQPIDEAAEIAGDMREHGADSGGATCRGDGDQQREPARRTAGGRTGRDRGCRCRTDRLRRHRCSMRAAAGC